MNPASDPGHGGSPGGAVPILDLLIRLPAAAAYVTGPDLELRFANDECRRLAGGRDLVGLPLREALPDMVAARRMVERAAESGQPAEHRDSEIWIRRPGAEPEQIFVDVSCYPVPDPAGGVGVLLYATDVTDRVQLRRRLRDLAGHGLPAGERHLQSGRRAQARLAFLRQVRQHTARLTQAEQRRKQLEIELQQAERLQTVGQLASGIAHDFSNLLAVVVGYVELAEYAAAEDPDPELRRILGEIRAATDRAVRLSRDLVGFNRRSWSEPRRIDVSALIEGMRSLLAVSLSGRAEVALELAPTPLPAVLADQTQLERVMLNLAVNARDAMPDGGKLTVGTRSADFDADEARAHPGAGAGRYVEISVRDTGVGMSPEVKKQIFERFFTTKPTLVSAGLGLSTVRGIVSDLGGFIEVDSTEGVGTAFRIYLPAAGQPAGSLRPAGGPDGARGQE